MWFHRRRRRRDNLAFLGQQADQRRSTINTGRWWRGMTRLRCLLASIVKVKMSNSGWATTAIKSGSDDFLVVADGQLMNRMTWLSGLASLNHRTSIWRRAPLHLDDLRLVLTSLSASVGGWPTGVAARRDMALLVMGFAGASRCGARRAHRRRRNNTVHTGWRPPVVKFCRGSAGAGCVGRGLPGYSSDPGVPPAKVTAGSTR